MQWLYAIEIIQSAILTFILKIRLLHIYVTHHTPESELLLMKLEFFGCVFLYFFFSFVLNILFLVA